jgi:hypothetical protein
MEIERKRREIKFIVHINNEASQRRPNLLV